MDDTLMQIIKSIKNQTVHWFGFDIDGTITDIKESRKLIVSSGVSKNPIKLFLLRRNLKKITPTVWPAVSHVHFITARPSFIKDATIKWLQYWRKYWAKMGMPTPQYIRTSHPPYTLFTNKEVGHWKAEVINKNNIEIYYEDNPEIRKVLIEQCPYTLILKESIALFDGSAFITRYIK